MLPQARRARIRQSFDVTKQPLPDGKARVHCTRRASTLCLRLFYYIIILPQNRRFWAEALLPQARRARIRQSFDVTKQPLPDGKARVHCTRRASTLCLRLFYYIIILPQNRRFWAEALLPQARRARIRQSFDVTKQPRLYGRGAHFAPRLSLKDSLSVLLYHDLLLK